MHCAMCGQEAHKPCYLNLLKKRNLINEKEKVRSTLFDIPGMYFLCPTCQGKIILFPANSKENETESAEKNSKF